VAITIPKNASMPNGGWPVLITGHGTGGSFRDAIDGGRADEVSNGTAGATTVNAATISIDLPMHGSRRGATTEGPETLFFNFVNPRAARDNVLQGAADLLSVIYFLEQGSVAAGDSPTNEAFSFDTTRLAMFMHSQGATHAALMIADEPLARNVVLSGVGGDLTQSLLNKTQPVDIRALLPLALLDIGGDGRLPTGDFHPALALFQMFFDSADPVNIVRRLHRAPRVGQVGTHVFMTYGMGDTYSPEATMQAYITAGSISAVNPRIATFNVASADAPVSANRTVNGETMTIAHRQYQPVAPIDGHFVASQTTEGRADTARFLLQALAGQTPVIGQ
jgi:pimeloyl-ACP methyl ester carboxylesterase